MGAFIVMGLVYSQTIPNNGNPNNIGLPDFPNYPPGVPTVPGFPGLPNYSGLPNMPSVPGLPGIPGAPTLPNAPSMQDIENLNNIRDTLPDLATLQEITDVVASFENANLTPYEEVQALQDAIGSQENLDRIINSIEGLEQAQILTGVTDLNAAFGGLQNFDQVAAAFQNIDFLNDLNPDNLRNMITALEDFSGLANVASVMASLPGALGPPIVGTFTGCGQPPLSSCDSAALGDASSDIIKNYITGLMLMTQQITASMMQNVFAIGSFMDAKMQLETEREIQRLSAEAHKDYHPSEAMCQFGTFVRSVSATESKGNYDSLALNDILTSAYTGRDNAVTAEGYAVDIESRILQFRTTYCDPKDNNDGLSLFCQHDLENADIGENEKIGAQDPSRINKDVDVARTLINPLTINVNFADRDVAPDEEDVIALARNLYWPRAIEPGIPLELVGKYADYQDARHLFAMHNVAHSSFAEIVGMKASDDEANADKTGGPFMKALLEDFGLEEEETHLLLGDFPSYYAHMEVLTKKIYQHPNFYTNLYDKPTNVKRIGVSMDSFKLMHGRDRFESALRREMLMSLLVEQALAKHQKRVNAELAATRSQ